MRQTFKALTLTAIAGASMMCATSASFAAATPAADLPQATIIILNRDPAGYGFNDPTPVAPVGGNPATTLGEQRLFVYRYVADIWQQNIRSAVPIVVNAGWENLTCDASSAVLGSAGARTYWSEFPNGEPNTYYHQALANRLAGVNLAGDGAPSVNNADIKTQFNARLGEANCLSGSPFYLGIDGKAGTKVNFVETLLHELGHGLGFSLGTTSSSTGSRPNGKASIWEKHMFDNTQQKTWFEMTAAQRVTSGTNNLKLAWVGPNVAAGQSLLAPTPVLKIVTPVVGVSGTYDYGAAAFGAPVVSGFSFGKMAVYKTQTGESGPGCDAFNAANIAAVTGKVAIISRGTCAFSIKAKNAQNAGAIGVLLANNANAILNPSGTDATITIPVVLVSQPDGIKIANAVAAAVPLGSRSTPGAVTGSFSVDPTRIAGADSLGRPLLYTPTVFAAGSSVSHWDVTATPNLLMEPNINSDLGIILTAPKDLTVPLLKDIGW
ncbi:PA domain-containing protein [Massilia sp. DWR3-1-1]|uniref:PA domain-containing protein n=1 Tax=Massilia sp. DWR3-1-1 TaxID=2804559 RepID=UPI003CF04621